MSDPRPGPGTQPTESQDGADARIGSELGPQLTLRLHSLLRSTRLYAVANQTVQAQIAHLMASLEAIGGDEVTLLFLGQYVYVNGVRIKPQSHHLGHFKALSADLTSRGLSGLRFMAPCGPDALAAFLDVFSAGGGDEEGESFHEAYAESGITQVIPMWASSSGDSETPSRGAAGAGAGPVDERSRARETFWNSVTGCRIVLENTARTRRPAMRHARRVVQPLVDTMMKNEFSILGLAALKNHDEYTYAHCVNVSMLSIAIGHRLGLPRNTLADLGVAALLHDLGKLAVPVDVLQKAGKLSREEWALIQRHPIEGMKIVSRLYGLAPATIETMRVCLLHHQTRDRRGYPEIQGQWRQSTLVRIVAAADCFDAMTGHRAYRSRPMTGYEALQQLLSREGVRFDQAVLWLLVRCVGVYPAGTVLRTDSGHTVISLSPNPNDPRRPVCRVLETPGGRSPGDEPVLWEPMPAGERVAQVLSPEETGIDVAPYLSGDAPPTASTAAPVATPARSVSIV